MRKTSVSCFNVEICYCHRCAFCCSYFKKNTPKNPSILPDRNPLKKISLPTHSVKGCQSFAAKCSTHARGPDHPLAEPCQRFPARASLPGLPIFCRGIHDHSCWPRAAGYVAVLWSCLCAYWARVKCLWLTSMGHGSHEAAALIPCMGPQVTFSPAARSLLG